MEGKNTHCKWCSAVNCTNSKNRRPDLAFFHFPRDAERSRKWVVATRRADLEKKSAEALNKNNVICEEHFEPCCFRQTKRKLLTNDAIPSLFDIPNPPPKQTPSRPPPKKRDEATASLVPDSFPPSSIFLSGSESLEGVTIQPTEQVKSLKRKLQAERTKACRLRKKMKLTVENQSTMAPVSNVTNKLVPDAELDSVKEMLAKYLPDETCSFILSQIRVSRLPKKGRRWTYSDKSFALSLYHASRKAYMLLQKKFALPSPKTLSLSIRNVNVQPGFCNNMMQLFKIKVQNMTDQEKLCAIAVDEMALKKAMNYDSINDQVEGLEDFGFLGRSKQSADHALVFMLRGVINKWKQPFAYFLSKGTTRAPTLQLLLIQGIREVINLGLFPKIVIWDQGSNNRAVADKLGISTTEPFFFVDGHKIFMMFDPPHLMKNIRNNLKKYGFMIGEDSVSWEYIQKFYELDSSLPIRMAPKLTKRHIMMPAFANLSVKLAVQILSHTVAAGIATMVKLKALTTDASATATFAEQFDRIFNCFNSRTLKSKTPMAHAISTTSEHVTFLRETLLWLNNLKCRNKSGNLPCITGWKITINCLLQLWDDLKTNHKIKFLLTSRLNQDCLENLFSVVRGKGGHRFNPDPCQFRTAVRQTMVDAILVTGERKNCQEDVDSFLFSFENITSQGAPSAVKTRLEQDVPRKLQPLLQANVDPSVFTAPETNILLYIGGYVARKLCSVVCQDCKSILTGAQENKTASQQQTFLHMKQYVECAHGGLIVPSRPLLETLQMAETIFRDKITSHIVTSGVRCKLVKKMIEATASIPLNCPAEKCAVKFMGLNLFTTIRLHHHIKCMNRDSVASSQKKSAQRKTGTFQHQ